MSCNRKVPCADSGAASEAHEDERTGPRPSAEALLAGTLALMTGVIERAALAQPLAAHGQSLLMAAKVRANLGALTAQPQLSEGFRATLGRLCGHWDRLAMSAPGSDRPSAAAGRPDDGPRLWHRAPARIQ